VTAVEASTFLACWAVLAVLLVALAVIL